jgi:hypothetical protein
MFAACAVLAGAGLARAEGQAKSPLTLQPTYLDETTPAPAAAEAAPAPTPDKPLMGLLKSAGIGNALADANINIYGFVEGSYNYNFMSPANDVNVGRVFDTQSNRFRMNQLDLTVERTVDATKGKFDVGGRMEWIYGSDAGFIHSFGLFDYYNAPLDPINQVDLNQAYVDFALPFGGGLNIRAGKFVTLLGAETINPTSLPFYSRSYLFGFAIPFTHTGVLGTYHINDKWIIDAGVVRGWEDSTKDKNTAPSYLGRVTYVASKDASFYLSGITGPEMADNTRDFRTVIDLVATWQATEALKLTANADYGRESNAAPDGSDAQWYGVALYGAYKINDYVTANIRGEWFRDEDGTRLGLGATSVYEGTVGVTITPAPNSDVWKNLMIRPELRWDHSSDDIFNGGTDKDQVTAAVDVIFQY